MKNEVKKSSSFYNALKTKFSMDHIYVEKPYSMPNFHYHNKYELYYLCSGERYYFIKDNTYSVRAGSFVLINKNDIHCTGILSDSPYDRFVINFDDSFFENMLPPDELEELLLLFKIDLGAVSISESDRQLTEMMLSDMLRCYENCESDLYLKTALIHILLIIKRSSSTQAVRELCEVGATHKTASRIVGYINNNFQSEITLESLSEKFYISPYYLSRTFKRVCGISFVDYLNNVRIKEAKKLLVHTKMSITEIGEAVGYKSNTHFGRVFKNITGTSPLTDRKRHK